MLLGGTAVVQCSLVLQVEWVLMRAMSLGLLEGEIDEVEQKVEITFIKVGVSPLFSALSVLIATALILFLITAPCIG